MGESDIDLYLVIRFEVFSDGDVWELLVSPTDTDDTVSILVDVARVRFLAWLRGAARI